MITNQLRYRGFSSENSFDREAFLSPGIDYAPIYTWMWNDRITREGIDDQLDEMERLGIRKFYILPMPKSFRPTSFPTPLEPVYLSKEYFDLYRYAVKQAASRGMIMWLYDEGGWPSGGACGQVMLEDPSLAQETVRVEERILPKDTAYQPTTDVEIAFCGERELSAGEALPKNAVITEYKWVKTSFPRISSADYPDVTKKGSTDLFLKLTHERYQNALGDLKETGVTALFTDEPTPPRPFPYTKEIKEAFLSHFGERIEPYLPLLTGRIQATEETAPIKIGFFRMMSELFCDRVLEKEYEWTHRAGVSFVGHLDKDDEADGSMTGGSFGLLSALRRFDVPGVDAIRRQIFPPEGKSGLYGENKFFPRLASSAAAQTGGRHALTESFAVYGNGLRYDEMRYVLNFQAMRGINVFNMMVLPYGRKGAAQAGLLPHFTETLYPDLKTFNEYATRLSYLFSLGERAVDIALYDPIEEGIVYGESALKEYEAIGRSLEKKGIPFDIVDDEFLMIADRLALQEGLLAVGKATYHTIVLPACRHLSPCGIETLRRFLTYGGRVLTTDEKLAQELGATYSPDLSLLSSPRPVNDEDISYEEITLSDGKIAFLMNESGESKRITLAIDGKTPYLIRPAEGEISAPASSDDKIALTLAAGEIVALLFTEREIPCAVPFSGNKRLPLDGWSYRPTERLRIGERAERIPLEEKEKTLPDKNRPFEDDFSGTILYRATFSLPLGAKRALLDLGKVDCVAKVTLNGRDLGKRIMPPYRFEIPLDLLRSENELVVCVTNTAANAFASTDFFDRYPKWRLGNYFEEEQRFHRESPEGGFFGDAEIFYE